MIKLNTLIHETSYIPYDETKDGDLMQFSTVRDILISSNRQYLVNYITKHPNYFAAEVLNFALF